MKNNYENLSRFKVRPLFNHGTIQPAEKMPLREFQRKLNESQPNWKKENLPQQKIKSKVDPSQFA